MVSTILIGKAPSDPKPQGDPVKEDFIVELMATGNLTLSPKGLQLPGGRIRFYSFCPIEMECFAKKYAEAIRTEKLCPDLIFAPTKEDLPLAAAVTQELGGGIDYYRHTQDGNLSLKGKQVLIVCDTMTAKVIEAARSFKAGGVLIGCVVAFDPQERMERSDLSAIQEFRKTFRHVPIHALARLADLVSVLVKTAPKSLNPGERATLIGNILAQWGLNREDPNKKV